MIDKGKHNLLGVLVDAVDYETAVERVLVAARARKRCTCAALAVHGVMTGVLDEEQRFRLNHLDLVVPDGQPVRWGLNLLYRLGLQERVYGPELTLRVCEGAAQESLQVYFYGSTPEVLESLQERLKRRFPGIEIAGAEPSRFRRLTPVEAAEVVERVRASGAAIVFVGLGCPRQEVWAFEMGDELSLPVLAVGAAFDFIAGTLSQAPPLLQRWGLEWLYRWLEEPARLWRRYLLLNPAYLALLLLQWLQLRRIDPAGATAPSKRLLHG